MDKIFVKINLLWATVLTFLTSAFGAYWYIFAAFMVLNVVDFFTGVEKAKYSNTENRLLDCNIYSLFHVIHFQRYRQYYWY